MFQRFQRVRPMISNQQILLVLVFPTTSARNVSTVKPNLSLQISKLWLLQLYLIVGFWHTGRTTHPLKGKATAAHAVVESLGLVDWKLKQERIPCLQTRKNDRDYAISDSTMHPKRNQYTSCNMQVPASPRVVFKTPCNFG